MMSRRFLLIISLAVVAFFCISPRDAAAQTDPHFSQYYAYPMWLNPGLTGVMDGDFRISANYKSQWATITNPFQTMALSFDAYPTEHFGWGMTVLDQSAGDGGWNYLNALGSAAFHLILDKKQMNVISIGIQGGIINRHFDPNKLQFNSQWNPITGYDPGSPSGEIFDETSSLDLDANAGLVYYNRNPNNHVNVFAGVSAYHLPRPYDPFYKNSKVRLPMRFNVHGGLRIKLSEHFNVTPQMLYLKQGESSELVGSLYAQCGLGKTSDLLFGATYRDQDAIIPFIGFHLGDFTLGMSYDVNTSDLKAASMNQGGMEISLTYIRHKKVKDLHFICPRL